MQQCFKDSFKIVDEIFGSDTKVILSLIYQNGKTMTHTTFTIGQEVVRTKGDYVVGRKGLVLAIDAEKNRVQVQWYGETKTWVSVKVVEPTNATPVNPEFTAHKVMYKGQEVQAINFGKL